DWLIVTPQDDPLHNIVARGGMWSSAPGGVDRDTVSFADFTSRVVVSLAQETATSAQGRLTLIEFEKVNGGRGNDVLAGDAQNNVLRGRGGNDILVGGAGHDRLEGGAGADTFRFARVDSHFDRVVDFDRAEGDRIDLSRIDADPSRTGDQAFSFIGGEKFHGRAGELRVVEGDGRARFALDADGDRIADLHVYLLTDEPLNLTEADFIL
ncbi:MAG: M10 family metallopeptidase C-terminal domain-containing protein, partial [Paracoccus sp. (in: a-proteobacteria)]